MYLAIPVSGALIAVFAAEASWPWIPSPRHRAARGAALTWIR